MAGTTDFLDSNENKLCAWRHNMPRPSHPAVGALAPDAPPSRRNVAVVSHAEYVPTPTAAAALRVKAALSKAAW